MICLQGSWKSMTNNFVFISRNSLDLDTWQTGDCVYISVSYVIVLYENKNITLQKREFCCYV